MDWGAQWGEEACSGPFTETVRVFFQPPFDAAVLRHVSSSCWSVMTVAQARLSNEKDMNMHS